MDLQILTSIPYEKLLEDLTARFKESLPIYEPTPSVVDKTDELLTRKQAAETLGISLPTLYDWSKKGILKPYRISSRIRYKKKEVLSALKQIKPVSLS
jgi:excisionase family DNA binding protein